MTASMTASAPLRIPSTDRFETHEVFNQPPALESYSVLESEPALRDGVGEFGAGWAQKLIEAFSRRVADPEVIEWGHLSNKHTPELKTHDRFGRRIDQVEFHPAWHELMRLGVENQVHSFPWNHEQEGAHVVRTALFYLLNQVENGVNCPLSMTYSGVPALSEAPGLDPAWVSRLIAPIYDPRPVHAAEKSGCLMGMALTEKQGGSDVRANTTRAVPVASVGEGETYELIGHKWFCSAPMCDAFLTLAQTEHGLSCFFVPRHADDGSVNGIRIQRLKNKLGNRSNASSEIEYVNARGVMLGEPGRGVPKIIEMVIHTRLDCIAGSAAIMTHAVRQALHHARHRRAFGHLLIDQPLMRSVIADLLLECEGATWLALRIAQSYDEGHRDPDRRPFMRLATALSKYWVCKRTPWVVYEALECHGGNGYVEDSIVSRLYREAPLNSIWEGSGNVICLDVLRTLEKEPVAVEALLAELNSSRGKDSHYDSHVEALVSRLRDRDFNPATARGLVQSMALALQASVLLGHAPEGISRAFCRLRLPHGGNPVFGVLAEDLDTGSIIARWMNPS